MSLKVRVKNIFVGVQKVCLVKVNAVKPNQGFPPLFFFSVGALDFDIIGVYS